MAASKSLNLKHRVELKELSCYTWLPWALLDIDPALTQPLEMVIYYLNIA